MQKDEFGGIIAEDSSQVKRDEFGGILTPDQPQQKVQHLDEFGGIVEGEETFEEFKKAEQARTAGETLKAAGAGVGETLKGIAKGVGTIVAAPVTLPFHATRAGWRKGVGDEKGAQEDFSEIKKTLTGGVAGGVEAVPHVFFGKATSDIAGRATKSYLEPVVHHVGEKIANVVVGGKGEDTTLTEKMDAAEEQRLREKFQAKKDAERGINAPSTVIGQIVEQSGLASKEAVSKFEDENVNKDVVLAAGLFGPVAAGAWKTALRGATKPIGEAAERIAEEAAVEAGKRPILPAEAVRTGLKDRIISGAEKVGEKIKEYREGVDKSAGVLKGVVGEAVRKIPGVTPIIQGGRILEKAVPIAEVVGGVGKALTQGSRGGIGALQTAARDVTSAGAQKALNFAGKIGGNIPINVVRQAVIQFPSTLKSAMHGAAIGAAAEYGKTGDMEGVIHGAVGGATIGATARVGLLPFEGLQRRYAEGVRTATHWMAQKTPQQRAAILRSMKRGNTLEDIVRIADAENLMAGAKRSAGKDTQTHYGSPEEIFQIWLAEHPNATPKAVADFKQGTVQRGFTMEDVGKDRSVAYINTDQLQSAQTAFHEALHQMFRMAPEGSEAAEMYNTAKQALMKSLNDTYSEKEMTDHLMRYMSKLVNGAFNNFDKKGLSDVMFNRLKDKISSITSAAKAEASVSVPEVADKILSDANLETFKLAKSALPEMTPQETLNWVREMKNQLEFQSKQKADLANMLTDGKINEAGREYIAEELLAEHNRSFMTRIRGFITPTAKKIAATATGEDISQFFNDEHTVSIADEGYLAGIKRLLNKYGVAVDKSGTPRATTGEKIYSVADLPVKVFEGMKSSPLIDRLLADLWARKAASMERFSYEAGGSPKLVNVMEPSMLFGVDSKTFIPTAMKMGVIETKLDADGNEVPALDKKGKPIFIKPSKYEKGLVEKDKLIHEAIMRGGIPDEAGALIPDLQKLKNNQPLAGSFLGQKSIDAILADPNIKPLTKRRIVQWNNILKSRWQSKSLVEMHDMVVDYNKVYHRGQAGAYATETRHVSPIGIQVTKAGHFNLLLFDVGHFKNKLKTKLERKPQLLAHWQGSSERLMGDVYRVMENHRNGRPGASGIGLSENPLAVDKVGQEKASIINALLDFGTKENRVVNEWYDFVNKKSVPEESTQPGSIRTFRLERIIDTDVSPDPAMFIDYPKGVRNFMPVEGRLEVEENLKSKDSIVNPIDPNATPEEKLAEIKRLTAENVPIIEKFIAQLDKELGTESKVSLKEPEKILSKAARPSILAEYPWHDIEHVRDTLRFKSKINSLDDVGKIFEKLRENGFNFVKLDTKKMFKPKPWGWRFAAFDMRMPNGQLVEFYTPIKELDHKDTKGPNHDLFEKWRNATPAELEAKNAEYLADVLTSKKRYDDAWNASLKRQGLTPEAAAASWRSFEDRLSSSTESNLSISSSAEGGGPPKTQSESGSAFLATPAESQTTTSPLAGSIKTSDGDSFISSSPLQENILPKAGSDKGLGENIAAPETKFMPATEAGVTKPTQKAAARRAFEQEGLDSPFIHSWADAPIVTHAQSNDFNYKTGEAVAIETYHGTPEGKIKLSPNRAGKNRENFGKLLFFTPSKVWAKNYAMPSDSYNWNKRPEPTAIKALIKMQNPLVVHAEGDIFRNVYPDAIEEMITGDHDGIIVRGVQDHPDIFSSMAGAHTFMDAEGKPGIERDPMLTSGKNGPEGTVFIVPKAKQVVQLSETPIDQRTALAQFMPANPNDAREQIKSAAVKFANGKIHEGFTHADAYASATKGGDFTDATAGKEIDKALEGTSEGFITNHGRFLSREEAFNLADKIGQINPYNRGHFNYGIGGKDNYQLEALDFDKQRRFMPSTEPIQRDVGKNEDFVHPPEDAEAKAALSSDRREKFGLARNLKEGTPIGVRIDIPAFKRTGLYVQSVHEPSATGKRIGDPFAYDTIIRVKNPKFLVEEDKAVKLKETHKKSPIATVEGNYSSDKTIPADIGDWTPAGFDPWDHSHFYDKRTDEPVKSGSDAIAVGNTVFVKDPVYGKREDYRYMPSTPAQDVLFPTESVPGERNQWLKDQLALPQNAKIRRSFAEDVRGILKSNLESIREATGLDVQIADELRSGYWEGDTNPTSPVVISSKGLEDKAGFLTPEAKDSIAKLGSLLGSSLKQTAMAYTHGVPEGKDYNGFVVETKEPLNPDQFKTLGQAMDSAVGADGHALIQDENGNVRVLNTTIFRGDSNNHISHKDYTLLLKETLGKVLKDQSGKIYEFQNDGDYIDGGSYQEKLGTGGGSLARGAPSVRSSVLEKLHDDLSSQVDQAAAKRSAEITGRESKYMPASEALKSHAAEDGQIGEERIKITPEIAKFMPLVNPDDVVGKISAPIFADRMKYGTHTSRSGRVHQLRGGPGFANDKAAWAVDGQGIATQFVNAAKDGVTIGLVTLMGEDAVAGNKSFWEVMKDELQYDAQADPKLKKILDQRAKIAAEAIRKTAKKKMSGKAKDAPKDSLVKLEVKDFDDLVQKMDQGVAFWVRAIASQQLASAEYKKAGGTFWKDVVRDVSDYRPEDGHRTGDVVKVIEIDPNPIGDWKQMGVDPHPSYSIPIRGRLLGDIEKPTSIFNVMRKDLAKEAKAEGKPQRAISPKGDIGPQAFGALYFKALGTRKKLTSQSLDASKHKPLNFKATSVAEREGMQKRSAILSGVKLAAPPRGDVGGETARFMPALEKRGKLVTTEEGEALKDLPVEKVEENIAVVHQKAEDGFVPRGWTMLYFFDTPEAREKFAKGEIGYLTFNPGTPEMRFNGYSMIDDLWKKSRQSKGSEHIIGALQADVDIHSKTIYADNLSVRPGWKRNTIASKLMDALQNNWKGYELDHSPATDQGAAFLTKRGQFNGDRESAGLLNDVRVEPPAKKENKGNSLGAVRLQGFSSSKP